MSRDHQPTEPVIHYRAMRLARRLVVIIVAVLRPEEIHECVREFYAAIREELGDKQGENS